MRRSLLWFLACAVLTAMPASANAARLTLRTVISVEATTITVEVRAPKATASGLRAVLQRKAGSAWRDAASAKLRRGKASIHWQSGAGAFRLRAVLRRRGKVVGISASRVVRVAAPLAPPTPRPAPRPTPVPTPLPAQHGRALAVGGSHGCEVTADAHARCWGDNAHGQVGDGTTTNRLLAVTVPGLDQVVGVAAGHDHTCALRADRTVWCWGSAAGGRLGGAAPAGVVDQLAPAQVPGLTGVTDLLAGGGLTCATGERLPWECWGSDVSSAVSGGPWSSPVPSALASISKVLSVEGGGLCWRSSDTGSVRCGGLPGPFTGSPSIVSASPVAGCAIVSAGSVECKAIPDSGVESPDPTTPLSVPGATDVAISGFGVCVARGAELVRCWDLAPLRDGDPIGEPTDIPGTAGMTELEAGGPTCGRVNGQTRCWGSPASGALGDGRDGRIGLPVPSELAGDVTKIAMDEQQACGIGPAGATCWGLTTRGNTETSFAAGPVIAGTQGATDVAVTGHGACVVTPIGTALCWGTIPPDSLAQNTSALWVGSNAVNIVDLAGVSQLDGGILASSTCALRQGSVVCWGGGDPSNGAWTPGTPRGAITGFSGVTKLSAGSGLCAIVPAGVRCQATDQNGLSGDVPTHTSSSTRPPLTLPGTAGAIDVDLGLEHACLVTGSGEVRCWGANVHGELGRSLAGTSDPTASNVVAPVPGISNAVDVAVGSHHSCAVRADGSVACWGANDYAQLGDPGLAGGETVRVVAGIQDALTIVAGGDTTCVTRSAHGLTCWGNGDELPYPWRSSELIAVAVRGTE